MDYFLSIIADCKIRDKLIGPSQMVFCGKASSLSGLWSVPASVFHLPQASLVC